MEKNYLVIKHNDFTYRVVKIERDGIELHIECVYKKDSKFCRWYRTIGGNRKISVNVTWTAFQINQQICFPDECPDPMDSLDLVVKTHKGQYVFHLFPETVRVSDYFDYMLREKESTTSVPTDAVRLNGDVERFVSDFQKDSYDMWNRLNALTLQLVTYGEKLEALENRNRVLESTLGAVRSREKTDAPPEQVKSRETVSTPPEEISQEPIGYGDYSGLTSIPEELIENGRVFRRVSCSEAVYERKGSHTVINCCKWSDEEQEQIVTSFHLYMSLPDGKQLSGQYIDAFSSHNVIKPQTVFLNLVQQHDLSIEGDNFPMLPHEYLIIRQVRVNIKISTSGSKIRMLVRHDVEFCAYTCTKKYTKIIDLYKGASAITFSDIQRACDISSLTYKNREDQVYVTAQLNHTLSTSFY